jgi:hypothetical protein
MDITGPFGIDGKPEAESTGRGVILRENLEREVLAVSEHPTVDPMMLMLLCYLEH